VDELINKYVYLRDDDGPHNRGVVMDRKEVGEWYKINGERHQVKAGLFKTSVAFSLKATAFFQPLPLNTNPAFKLCLSNSTYATTARRARSTSSTSRRPRTSATDRATRGNAVIGYVDAGQDNMRYCSLVCQRIHWRHRAASHKTECGASLPLY
jgi:hypothetical protein